MTTAGGGNRAEFANPPVRSVYLTVYFEPIVGLQVTHLAPFRQTVRDEFPDTAEMPPVQPLNRAREETKLLPVSRSWPFPYVLYTSTDETSSIALQNDRFVRSWKFSSEPSSYPGFDSLFGSLRTQFARFVETVESETDHDVRVTGSEAWYSNRLDDMQDSDLLVGVATRWTGDSRGSELKSRYSGIRLHLCDEDELEGCSINLAVDQDTEGTDMVIEVSYMLPTDETEGDRDVDPELGGLAHAHEHVIKTFLEYTSDDMRAGWGAQS